MIDTIVNKVDSTPEQVSSIYERSKKNISKFIHIVDRPLTLTEKILVGHLVEIGPTEPQPGKSYVLLTPDRVALQDLAEHNFLDRKSTRLNSSHGYISYAV